MFALAACSDAAEGGQPDSGSVGTVESSTLGNADAGVDSPEFTSPSSGGLECSAGGATCPANTTCQVYLCEETAPTECVCGSAGEWVGGCGASCPAVIPYAGTDAGGTAPDAAVDAPVDTSPPSGGLECSAGIGGTCPANTTCDIYFCPDTAPTYATQCTCGSGGQWVGSCGPVSCPAPSLDAGTDAKEPSPDAAAVDAGLACSTGLTDSCPANTTCEFRFCAQNFVEQCTCGSDGKWVSPCGSSCPAMISDAGHSD